MNSIAPKKRVKSLEMISSLSSCRRKIYLKKKKKKKKKIIINNKFFKNKKNFSVKK